VYEVKCYNCNSNEATFYATENGYNLVKCSGCGLLYVNPRPSDDEIVEGAQQGLHKGDVTLDHTGKFDPVKLSMYRRVLKDIYPNGCTGKSWLDIGCGHGELLASVNDVYNRAISIKGTEPNVYKQEAARKRGLDVTYFDIFTHDSKYDVISLLNVFSHLPDPLVFLRRCKDMLASGGELIIQTGDSAHFSPEEHFRPLFLPDHLSFASEKIVRDILVRSGFEVVTVKHYPIIYPHIVSVGKEILKLVWPGKKSRIRYMMSPKYRADMFVKARMSS
jgi:2-polyprenyl-3-methyl-5-hydroxy-6-metoxy-1,4-benzoquinol methylase